MTSPAVPFTGRHVSGAVYQAPGPTSGSMAALIPGQSQVHETGGDHHDRTSIRARRVRRAAASRGPRVAAALAAAALMAALTASLTGAARLPAPVYPVQAAFASPGPYATTTGTVTDSAAR